VNNRYQFNFVYFILAICSLFLFTNLAVGRLFLSDVFTVFIAVVLFFCNGLKCHLNRNDKIIYSMFFIYAIYSLLIVLFHGSDYMGESLRNFRVPLYYYIVKSLFIRYGDKLSIAILVLLVVHLTFVVIGALNKDFFNIVAPLIRYEKQWWYGRGNGLTTSYDTAGFLIIVGIILLSNFKARLALLVSFILVVAGFFTGRTFMVLGPITFILYYFIFQHKVLLLLAIVTALSSSAIFYVSFSPSMSLVHSAIGFFSQIDGYYNTTGRLIEWGSQFSDYVTIFGTGHKLIGVDIGYLKTLHYGGVGYLFLQLFILIVVPFVIIDRNNVMPIVFLILLFFIYNIKIYAFFASIYMPAFFLLIFSLKDFKSKKSHKLV